MVSHYFTFKEAIQQQGDCQNRSISNWEPYC